MWIIEVWPDRVEVRPAIYAGDRAPKRFASIRLSQLQLRSVGRKFRTQRSAAIVARRVAAGKKLPLMIQNADLTWRPA